MSKRSIAALLILSCLAAAGCGYRLAGRGEGLPRDIRSIGIAPLGNATRYFEIEQKLTGALVREFSERTRFAVYPRDSGVDAVLRGAVTSISATPVQFGRETFGSTFLVSVTVSLRLESARDGRTLYRNDNLLFRDQYVINSDVANFFSEESPAVERLMRDLAASVVSSILESF